ncbi:PspA/IM30 family protein [Vreelandella rituensis]|uniref:PspA/IM30 family protein n=1 Tax=Vreelandella rituensis TaxID=2282306 RepID=A0A368U8S4_9GAMM|nr:PspA/IM30 family protein [Halomonas rituensis]RCV93579.1 PspA/IM30 family protein [Halomonas rituensis]
MLLRKMFTALRGKATETGEAIVDSQSIRIMEQELRDAQKALDGANTELTSIMAQRNRAVREAEEIQSKITEYEVSALAALDKGDEGLAGEVAERISQLESDKSVADANAQQYDQTVASLKSTIAKSKQSIRHVEQQKSHVKATAAAQKAQAAVASKHAGQNASMSSAMASLDRIKEKQAQNAEQMKVAQELEDQESGADLDKRLAQAGINGNGSTSSNDVLARLKAKRQGTASDA